MVWLQEQHSQQAWQPHRQYSDSMPLDMQAAHADTDVGLRAVLGCCLPSLLCQPSAWPKHGHRGCWSSFCYGRSGSAALPASLQNWSTPFEPSPTSGFSEEGSPSGCLHGHHTVQGKSAAVCLVCHTTAVRLTVGLRVLQMMGGRYRNVMPSDLFKRGALARGSLPAPGKQYASENFRDELRILMRRYTSSCQFSLCTKALVKGGS